MVDLTRDADGCLHARLLDAVQGRSGRGYAEWLREQGIEVTVSRRQHRLARTSPRNIPATGLTLAATGAALLPTASGTAPFATNLFPGLLVLGLGVGMVFVAVFVTAMAGISPQHAGMASGLLMTGHEVGAALGVAVLSAPVVGHRERRN
jgi:MFS family permease